MRTRWSVDPIHRAISSLRPERLRNLVALEDTLRVGDGVDVATGRVLLEDVDLALEGRLRPAMVRTYSSGWQARDGSLGPGWSHPYALRVIPSGEDLVLHTPDGRELVFDRFGRGDGRRRHPLDPWTLTFAGEGLVATRGDDRVELIPRREGYLPTRWSRGRDALVFQHRDDGLVHTVEGAAQRLVFSHDGPRVASVHLEGRAGQTLRAARYTYDAAGDLVEARAAGDRRFTYEYVSHLLVARVDANEARHLYGYDGMGADARCVRTWLRGAPQDHRELRYEPSAGTTTVLDGLGQRHYFEHDLVHRPTVVDTRTKLRWDKRSVAESRVSGAVVAIERDGARVQVRRDDGLTEHFELDEAELDGAELDGSDRVVAYTDANEERTTQRFDDVGDLCATEGPNHRASVSVADGRPREIVLGDRWVELSHDAGGHLTRVKAGDEAWEAEHDWLGRPVLMRGPGVERRLTRTEDGRITCVQEGPDRRDFDWTPGGRLRRARVAEGDWAIEWSPAGLPTHLKRPDLEARLTFDAERRLEQLEDGRGRRWTFVRDELGRVVEEEDFEGRGFAFAYCGTESRVREMTVPDGSRIAFHYDASRRLVRAVHGQDRVERFSYGASGRLVSATRDDVTVTLERGRGGEVVAEHVGGDRVESRIDILGRRTLVESSLGARIARTWEADGTRRIHVRAFGDATEVELCGREVRVGALRVPRGEDRLPVPTEALGELRRDPSARAVHYDVGGRAWVYGLSADGLVEEARSPEGLASRYAYDAFGRRVSVAGDGAAARYVWDRAVCLHEISSHAPPTVYVFDPRDGTPIGKVQPGGVRRWLGLFEDDLAALFDEHTGRLTTEVWPWRGGLAVDGRTGLWVGPGYAFHRGGALPMGYGTLEDELFGPTAARPFDFTPHVARLMERASDASLARFLVRLTTPDALLEAPDRLPVPFPEPVRLPDLRPRGRVLLPRYAR